MPKSPECIHCKAEVWWGLPRPEDPCFECGKPIGFVIGEKGIQTGIEAVKDMFGLDEFEQVAMAELLRDLDQFKGPPTPDSEHERKLMELGALVTRGRTTQEFMEDVRQRLKGEDV